MENKSIDISVSRTILAALISREEFTRKVLPYIKTRYFDNQAERLVCTVIEEYLIKYNSAPPAGSLKIELNVKNDLNESIYKESLDLVDYLYSEPVVSYIKTADAEWLIKVAEDHCKYRALYNGIMDSIEIIDGKKKEGRETVAVGAIPQILSDALAVCFDPNIGHDYFDQSDQRFDFYRKPTRRIRTRLEWLNKITKGGFPEKTLNVFAAATNVGKTIWLCSLAADALLDGYNVLYITLEMSEEMINQRIDANLLDISMDQIETVPEDLFKRRVADIRKKTAGKLITKEYPTGAAHVLHFKALMNELKLKKHFKPDIIFIDYLNICDSAKISHSDGMYSFMKKVAEELRGFGIENTAPIVTATQLNREGAKSSDYEMTDISESFGVAMTADFMVGLISTDQLEQMGQMRVKQLKNRYCSVSTPKSFLVGVDKSKMRIYNTDNPAPDHSNSQSHFSAPSHNKTTDKFKGKGLFSDFKV